MNWEVIKMRTKKIEKQINKIINEADQVPNYVLNQAKSYMKLNQKCEARYPVFRKFGFRIGSLVSTVILLICVIIPIVIIDTNIKEEPTRYGDSNNLNIIRYSSLDKEEISSIEQYNETNHSNYFSFKNLKIESSYLLGLSSKQDFFLLEEAYSYEAGKIHMYLHDVKYTVDMDDLFLLFQEQDSVKDIVILSCIVNEHTTRIFFRIDEIGYFITMENIEDYRPLLVEMLQG